MGTDHVGPSDDVDVLRRERDEATARARELEHELGALRGRVKRLELVMWRRTARRQRLAAWVRRLGGMLPPRRSRTPESG
jgi:hypothetical protein